MTINKHTKVSVVIKHNMGAIDVIASINPHFKKLKNPVLRALLAPRVSLMEAAKIGKCDINILFKKLQTLGFIVQDSTFEEVEVENNTFDICDFKVVKSIDVRPIIKNSEDPFLLLIDASKKLNTGETLEVINSFEPIPLIRILSKKGFSCNTIVKDGSYFIYIEKQEIRKERPYKEESIIELSTQDFLALENKLTKKILEIDVRDLEMPLPMLTILEKLEQLTIDQVLKVHHKKVPQFLFPELIQRNFKANYHIISDQEVTLLISH